MNRDLYEPLVASSATLLFIGNILFSFIWCYIHHKGVATMAGTFGEVQLLGKKATNNRTEKETPKNTTPKQNDGKLLFHFPLNLLYR